MIPESGVDAHIMLAGDLNGTLDVVEIFVYYWFNTSAILSVELGYSINASDKAGDGRVLDGWVIRLQQAGQDTAAAGWRGCKQRLDFVEALLEPTYSPSRPSRVSWVFRKP